MHEQIGRQSGGDIIIEYLERYRKVELELTLDFVGQLGAAIDRGASTFMERSQFAGELIIRIPGFEPMTMAQNQLTATDTA